MNSASSEPSYAIQSATGLSRVLTWGATAAVAVTTLWVLAAAQRDIRADFASGTARFAVQRWAEGVAPVPGRAPWESERAELAYAADLQPLSASLQESLGTAWMLGAVQDWASPTEKTLWLQNAKRHFRRATELRPRDGLTWALLASAMARSGNTGPEMHAIAEKALQLGPREGHVQQAVLSVVLEHWDQASPTLQNWASNLFEQGTQAQRNSINRMGEPFGILMESELPARDVKALKKQGAS